MLAGAVGNAYTEHPQTMNAEPLTVVATDPPPPSGSAVTIGGYDRMKFAIVRGFLWGWARLFSLKGLYLFGQFFGTVEYLINHKRRRRFREQLRMIYGDQFTPKLARRATRRHFTRIRCDKLFYLIFDRLPREKILKRVRFRGRAILDEQLKRGKGAYVTLSHNGSHHVAGLLMALLGYRVAGVRDRNEAPLRKYVQDKYAETFPEFRAIRVFYADSFPRDLYRSFEEGYILGSALDVQRDRGSHLKTLPVTIFGQQREFITGTMRIALRCGAPILQGFVVSRRNFYFRLIIMGPLVDPAASRDDAETLAAAMQAYATNIEHHVRKHPDHISRW
jgi:KDO2-lipid IV(A) lauroyltransferase